MCQDFVLIRHGQSTWNAAGRWQGQGDPPLSELGRSQARSLARELAAEVPTRLLASDLVRARETAEILGRELGLEVELESGFRELDVGEWSGLTAPEVHRRWPDEVARFLDGDLDLRAGGGESWRELRVRALGAFERWAGRSSGSVAVVTHGGLLRSLLGLELRNAQWQRAALAELRAHADTGV
jgi:broad specificity phosphatase PhoE